MAEQESFIECIYCKKIKEGSREHVIQKALGGNLTIKFVCKDCNIGFSKIDQALVENSFVAFNRVAFQNEPHVKLGGEHLVQFNKYQFEIKTRGGFTPKLKPQIGFVNYKDDPENLKLNFGCDSLEDALKIMNVLKEYIKNDIVDKIHIKEKNIRFLKTIFQD